MIWVFLTIIPFLALVSFSAYMAKKQGVLWFVGTFVGLLVTANILANKLIVFWKYAIPAGMIAYAATFLVTDMISEFYGKKQARRAVWVGFFASIASLIAIEIAIHWPGAPFWHGQEAFVSTLGNTNRIIFASMVAYLISQNYDVWMFSLIKKKTHSKYLWLRNNLSTMSSQLIDTLVFIPLAFYGLFPILPIVIGHYLSKLAIAVLDTPFMYLARHFFKNT